MVNKCTVKKSQINFLDTDTAIVDSETDSEDIYDPKIKIAVEITYETEDSILDHSCFSLSSGLRLKLRNKYLSLK